MNELFRHLNYDSQLFGYKVASISPEIKTEDISKVISDLKKENYKVAYWSTDNPQSIPSNTDTQNFAYAGAKVTYVKQLTGLTQLPDPLVTEYAHPMASEKLTFLALQSGIHSRFHTDPMFSNHEFEKLYIEWIEKSVNHQIADFVFVFNDEKSEPMGMVTLAIKDDESTIGLIAVDETVRGKRIGMNLLLKVEQISLEKHCSKVFVATQKENLEACRFYEKNGFVIFDIKYVYHIWL